MIRVVLGCLLYGGDEPRRVVDVLQVGDRLGCKVGILCNSQLKAMVAV